MKSWTRTLNLDDAHNLLALARPGLPLEAWSEACDAVLPGLSIPRKRELIRLVRDGFLSVDAEDRITRGLFLDVYSDAPADGQLDLVDVQWAMSHPITLVAVEALVRGALDKKNRAIALEAVDAFVGSHLDTDSDESRRKTRTVLLGALEGIGTIVTRGTGQHRSLEANRGAPHPVAFAYLIRRELEDRGVTGMMRPEAIESSVAVRLTQCGPAHAERCVDWAIRRGLLRQRGDEIAAPG